ncbi:ring-opening amidohydrolase [Gracilibacillus sp. YIM 98692]|uniref:ring-opening amidohydrolase n=1 Tax=Gracilibacillus sp. YIM 98692 TaxID=2663532 RepID=UPI0013D4B885|nr:ring-opening amidohydrolase [Gracilibacillus sp. YIM 98692]
MNYQLIRCDMQDPGDVSGMRRLLEDKVIEASEIKAIIAQTEGDGYARGYATLSFQVLLSKYLNMSHQEIFDQIPMMMIGKTGGLMTPHYTLFIKKETEIQTDEKRFAFGIASTPILKKEQIGTLQQVDLVANAVREAIADAGIDSLSDVKCVEVKCPWGDGGVMSKAASALGSAVALEEVNRSMIKEDSINQNHNLYSKKTSVSAGQEQTSARVIVMGNTKASSSDLLIGSGVMEDALDLEGLYHAFEDIGINQKGYLKKEVQDQVVQVFVNAGADAISAIRERRHTMHSDALAMHAGIVAKAVANAVVGSYIGETRILCSAGSEHQGPQGANLVAPVIRMTNKGAV